MPRFRPLEAGFLRETNTKKTAAGSPHSSGGPFRTPVFRPLTGGRFKEPRIAIGLENQTT